MTLLDAITKLAGLSGPALVAFLERVARDIPDLAEFANNLLAKLNAALTTEGLVALGAVIPGEIANVAQGKLDGRSHPSDIV